MNAETPNESGQGGTIGKIKSKSTGANPYPRAYRRMYRYFATKSKNGAIAPGEFSLPGELGVRSSKADGLKTLDH